MNVQGLVPAISDFSAVKCGFYGLERKAVGSSKATSHDWTIADSAGGKDPEEAN